jgi:hypothetical protein
LLGDGKRLWWRHDPELLARVVDDSDFPDTDPFVGADAVVPARRSVESDNGLLLKEHCWDRRQPARFDPFTAGSCTCSVVGRLSEISWRAVSMKLATRAAP